MMRTSNRTNRRLLAFVALLTVSLVCPTAGLAGQWKGKSKTDELIEEYARAFRVQVYETFHDDREEYDWRIKKGKEAVKLYKTLEKPVKQQVIVGWFQLAMETSRPNANTKLPNIPNLDFFGKSDEVAENSDSGKPADSNHYASDDVEKDRAERDRFDTIAAPDPLENFVNSELQSASGDASDEELMPVQPKPTMVEAPRAEIEYDEELMGLGDEELTASSELANSNSGNSGNSDMVNATDDEGGLDFEELDAPQQEPMMASSDNGSADGSGTSVDPKVSDDWADVAVADVVNSANDNGFPGVLETNARIAGLNLALQGVEAQSKVAFTQSPQMASALAKKLQTLAETNRQIQDLISMAPANERVNLIKLAPFNESANRFLMQFRAVGAGEMGISNVDRLKLIGGLEDFAR